MHNLIWFLFRPCPIRTLLLQYIIVLGPGTRAAACGPSASCAPRLCEHGEPMRIRGGVFPSNSMAAIGGLPRAASCDLERCPELRLCSGSTPAGGSDEQFLFLTWFSDRQSVNVCTPTHLVWFGNKLWLYVSTFFFLSKSLSRIKNNELIMALISGRICAALHICISYKATRKTSFLSFIWLFRNQTLMVFLTPSVPKKNHSRFLKSQQV
jgi:hypothetical protein